MTASFSIARVTKAFGETLALDAASFDAREGEITFVCGENGAGKSTLLKVAAGLLAPDEGEVRLFGKRLDEFSPTEARRLGVAMVAQHFSLAPALTGLENLVLGAEPTRFHGLLLDRVAARERAGVVERELGATLALDRRVSELGVGDKQRLEIARGLYRGARILILDEPTAVLTKQEADALYAQLERLAAAGRVVVVVSHKLDEVRAYGARATALRRGRAIAQMDLAASREAGTLDVTMRELRAAIMGVGDDHAGRASKAAESAATSAGEETLRITSAKLAPNLVDVSLAVRRGEVVGIAGVQGNGQAELVELLSGSSPEGRSSRSTSVRLGDRQVSDRDIAVVHADRQREGLVLDATIAENATLGDLGRFSRFGFLDVPAMANAAEARLARIEASLDVSAPARSLSGGNQQKIVVARALAKEDAKILVLAEPTRGVDVGAARAIHDAIRESAKTRAVVVVSSDTDELRRLADRILVLARGRFAGEFLPSATDADLGRAMLGAVDGAL